MNEHALLDLLESREAEADAKAEWTAQWVEDNRPLLLAGMLGTDAATLLAEGDRDQFRQLNQAIYLLMQEGEPAPLMQLLEQVMDQGLTNLAHDAWNNHLAELQDAMSEAQFEQYLDRRSAA